MFLLDPQLAALRLCELHREAENERLASFAASHRAASSSALSRLVLGLATRTRSVLVRPGTRTVPPASPRRVRDWVVAPGYAQKGCR